ncbi:HAMP domain-containing sensor histidine kinase [Paenibacillus sp. L3-i20]|uniref:sensor histidine kinase n=1 Tax=Paenibacillus sp. L3-i20 TaxID=2905833 RepID=UPI001EDFD3D3|nr:HAMP domain-containing sensor histidine kinase [Paenibacillus sp. L3-i20]GKU77375.1 hypothetical protein L3i20_v217720 [Paenibacillus sp. L3-i20]
MIKTLYVRVVLTYVAAVAIGLISTYYLSLLITTSIGERYIDRLQKSLVNDVEIIREIYEDNGYMQASKVMKQKRLSKKYDVRQFDSNGKLLPLNKVKQEELYVVSQQEVQSVLDGEVYKGYEASSTELVIGFPYVEDGIRYALFVETSESSASLDFSILLTIALIINFIVGCSIMIVGARYLVRPLRGMKAATEQLARGEFNINLGWSKRKDELGQLTQSFNYMASQMQQLEKMRQTFVSNVSHEIQSPLTSISGFSKALQHNDLSEEERIRYLRIIEQESERVSRLSENLLKLASLDSEHHPFDPVLYELDEQLRKAVVASEPQWLAKSLNWSLDLSRTKIKGDVDQLNQVWINLIGNSIKFTPEGGQISIHIVRHVESIEVHIKDTGIGIPEEDTIKVFERFYKADRSHNKNKSGNGLGLAIVKKIVSRHHGTITLKSSPGEGTTVIVTLPHLT